MAIQWWTTHSLDKLFPEGEKPAGASQRIVLKAARNETEDAQVAIRIPKDVEIRRARFSFSDLVGSRGRRISRRRISAWWVWYIYVHNNPRGNTDPASVLRRAPAFFPDAFLEEKEIGIRDEWTQPLWVSINVPKGTLPGEYAGTLTVRLEDKNDGKHRFKVPISLTVWPFTLPEKPTLHHDEWFNPERLADYYRIEPWSEAHWEWIAKVAGDMARHRQDTITTPFQSFVKVTQQKSGRLSFDFSRLDRWLRVFKKAGVEWIQGGHVAGRSGGWTSNMVWNRFPVYTEDGKQIDASREKMSEKAFEPYVEAFFKAVHAHLKKRGREKQYVQAVADEPIPENEASWCYCAGNVRKWLPGVKTINAVMTSGLKGYIDIRIPQIQDCAPDMPRNPGEDLWTYVCLYPQGHYPNRFLDYPSIRNRIIFWLAWSLGLKGFLHWGYNYWTTWAGVPVKVDVSPWMDASAGSIYCADRQPLPAGDSHLVYPGRKTICSGIRWEVVRKGMEDFEYLRMLDEAARRAESRKSRTSAVTAARRLLKRVKTEIARDSLRYTRDDALLLKIRDEAGALLARLCPSDSVAGNRGSP